MKTLFYLMITAMLSGPLLAQETITNQTAREEMKKLSSMEGFWKGSGYAIKQGGEKHEFQQTEDIKYLLDGTILNVIGRGVHMEDTTKVAHHALGIFYYDVNRKGLFFDGHLVQGNHTYAHAKINDDGRVIWWFETPSGDTIRYIIEIKNDRWIEDGFFIRKGTDQLIPFFHMELDRVASL